MRRGQVVAGGSDPEAHEHCSARTEILHGHETAVVPGLVDAHIHPFHAQQTRGADLTRSTTLAEVQFKLARERREIGGNGWVLGWRLAYNVFGDRAIAAEAIEDAVGGAPALVTFFDLHTALASRHGLELAGVSGPRAFSEGAEVVIRDERPTGELREGAAIDLVRRLLPELTGRETYARIAELQRKFAAVGLTGLHVMDGSSHTAWTLWLGPERCARAWRAGDLLRTGALVPFGSDWPVAGHHPRIGLAWAQLRRTPGDRGAHVFEPEQALSGLEALAGYTLAAARVAGEAAVSGRIASRLPRRPDRFRRRPGRDIRGRAVRASRPADGGHRPRYARADRVNISWEPDPLRYAGRGS